MEGGIRLSKTQIWSVIDTLQGVVGTQEIGNRNQGLVNIGENGFNPRETATSGAQNDLLQSRADEFMYNRAKEGMTIITVFALFSIIILNVYIAWAWLNIVMVHGYPVMHLPGSPGPFVTERYSAMRIFVYLIAFNAIPPILLLLSATYPVGISGNLFYNLSLILAGIVNIIAGISLLFQLWFFCQSANASMSTLANDVYWCCVHWPSNQVKCGFNINPGICAKTLQSQLRAPLEYIISIIVAFSFLLLTYFSFLISWRMSSWDLWRL